MEKFTLQSKEEVCIEKGKKPFGRSMKGSYILKKSFPKKDETVIGQIDVI